MTYHCAVKGCGNGSYRLNKWQQEFCQQHQCYFGTAVCICEPPFRLFPFPTERRDADSRHRWKVAVNRADAKKPWQLLDPSKNQRVCSQHFVDGSPTVAHPDPELDLGYESIQKQPRKAPSRRSTSTEAAPSQPVAQALQETRDTTPEECEVHDEGDDTTPGTPHEKLMEDLQHQIAALKLNNKKLQQENQMLLRQNNKVLAKSKGSLCDTVLKSDEDCLFYTGISSLDVFHKLHGFVQPFVRRMWRGSGAAVVSTRVKRLFRGSPKKFGPQRKLPTVDEYLLVLMKLRLGLLNKDLASRFGVSLSLVSNIFTSWITALSKTIDTLVFWPTQEQILATKPLRYKHLKKLVSIIDCSEIFIEKPKNMDLQFATWSDYKHHNTLKFLVSVTPNSAISYISPLYCGRVSDKALTVHCGFLDLLEPYTEIMADKGFPLQQECDARRIYLHVPAGKRGTAQMCAKDLERTKQTANLRILVEQVIRRLKTFRIIRGELPLSLVALADKILQVIAGLCNLQEPIYKL